MDLHKINDIEWRSADPNSDILHEESITESINDQFNLYNEKYLNNPATDTVICNKQTADGDNIVFNVEEGLLDAMHNLQIASVKKVQHLRGPMIVDKNFQDDKNIHENETFKEENPSAKVIRSETKKMDNRAMKLLITQPSKKATKCLSSSLNTKSKTEGDITINQLNSSRVVKTISSTENGIELKDEKINFFGIPVTVDHKKRTQVKPFNFQNRTKKNQQMQDSSTILMTKSSSLSMKSVNAAQMSIIKSKIVLHSSENKTKINNNKTKIANTIANDLQKMKQTQSNSNTLSNLQDIFHKNITMRKFVTSEHAQKTNKENNMSDNNAIVVSQKIKQKVISNGPKLLIDKRAKDRQIFNAKIRQRAIEIEEMRARVEQKKREKAKLEKDAPGKKI